MGIPRADQRDGGSDGGSDVFGHATVVQGEFVETVMERKGNRLEELRNQDISQLKARLGLRRRRAGPGNRWQERDPRSPMVIDQGFTGASER